MAAKSRGGATARRRKHDDEDEDDDDDVGSSYDGGPSSTLGDVDTDAPRTSDYVAKRDRNNVAVKKSRIKSRRKALQTQERVTALRDEKSSLEQRVSTLHTELALLKDLFVAHANRPRQVAAPDGGGGGDASAMPPDHEYSAAVIKTL